MAIHNPSGRSSLYRCHRCLAGSLWYFDREEPVFLDRVQDADLLADIWRDSKSKSLRHAESNVLQRHPKPAYQARKGSTLTFWRVVRKVALTCRHVAALAFFAAPSATIDTGTTTSQVFNPRPRNLFRFIRAAGDVYPKDTVSSRISTLSITITVIEFDL
jgi:hypothetical protein